MQEEIKELKEEIGAMRAMLEQMFTAWKRPQSDWIPEDQAAAMCNYAPKKFREKVLKGEISIGVTSEPGKKYNTKYQYCLKDINAHLERNAIRA